MSDRPHHTDPDDPDPAGTPRAVAPWRLFGLDIALVIVFAILGRAAHDESLGIAGVARTAWPFLVGLLAGWIVITLLGRAPETVLPGGIVIWLLTIGIGLPLWGAFYGTQVLPHISFVLVAGTTTFVLLNGARVILGRRTPQH